MTEIAIPDQLVKGSPFVQELIWLLKRHDAIGNYAQIDMDVDMRRDWSIEFVIPEQGPSKLSLTLEVEE